MMKNRIATLGVIVVWMLGAALPCPAEGPGPEAWRKLFNGTDLAGWDGDAAFWRVAEGVIIGETTAESPARRNTFLIWRGEGEAGEKPADFELKLQTS